MLQGWPYPKNQGQSSSIEQGLLPTVNLSPFVEKPMDRITYAR